MHTRLLALTLNCCLFHFIHAQTSQTSPSNNFTCTEISFQKIYNISISSRPSGLIQTKDGGYLVSGVQTDELIGNGDGFLLKLDRKGEKQWLKGYNREGSDYLINCSAQFPDSSYITVADQFDSHGTLQKSDKNGILIWQKAFSIQNAAVNFLKVITNNDGSFIATGILTEISGFEGSTIVAKFDGGGNILWQRAFNNSNHINYPSEILTKGDTLLINGVIPGSAPENVDTIYIMKMACLDGAIYSAKKLWYQGSLSSNLVKRNDDQYILAWCSTDINSGAVTVLMTELNESLNVIKTIKLNGLPAGIPSAAGTTYNNGSAMLFHSADENIDYFIKFDQNLNATISKYYPQVYNNSSQYFLTTIINASDSGFLLGGFRIINDSSVVYLVKTDSAGNSGPCKTMEANLPVSESTNINSESFGWESSVALNLLENVVDVPSVDVNNFVSTLCSDSSCNNQCNFLAPGGQIYICHVPAGNTQNPQQLTLTLIAAKWHLLNHPYDKLGQCNHPCPKSDLLDSLSDHKILQSGVFQSKHGKVKIHPNPSSNTFSVDFEETGVQPIKLKVYTQDGRLVYTLADIMGVKNIEIGENFQQGVYFVQISYNNKNEIMKIVKLH